MGLLALVLGVFGAVYFQEKGSPQPTNNERAQTQVRRGRGAPPQAAPAENKQTAAGELNAPAAALPAPQIAQASPATPA